MKRSGWVATGALLVLLGGGITGSLAWNWALGPAVPGALIEGTALSGDARELVDRALEGLDVARVLDHHAHLAGLGSNDSGCELSPEHLSWAHPWKRLQTLAYMRAGGVEDPAQADAQFALRLRALQEHPDQPGRALVLAFEHAYSADGKLNPERSEFHVPLRWVQSQVDQSPGRLLAAASIHPWRPDALEQLEAAHRQGVRVIKWLPNSMGMDPADPRCDAFYAALARLDMTLLSHAGEEQAVDAADSQELGNPLRLRRALRAGVRVIVAHCATLGEFEDLDHPAQRASGFALFSRMMEESGPQGGLWGDLSAVTLRNRDVAVLRELLERTGWHGRLVNGSDWPLPAIRVLTDLDGLQAAGLLSAGDLPALRELHAYHPLLFDLVLKRSLRGREGTRFGAEVFEARKEIVAW